MGFLRWLGGIVFALWLIGFIFNFFGTAIHLLLIASVVIFLADLIFGRRRV
ncbi:lmo0937 family membrane protein [Clostridium sp.]|uniref:lmo0937 family membrane protein n=1 Tax=Clostridium sp. TaxID=1506 RepID=UPI002FC83760